MFKGVFKRNSDNEVIAKRMFDTEAEMLAWRDELSGKGRLKDAYFEGEDKTVEMDNEKKLKRYQLTLLKSFDGVVEKAIADGLTRKEFKDRLETFFSSIF